VIFEARETGDSVGLSPATRASDVNGFIPGAHAPGFMPTPAPQAKTVTRSFMPASQAKTMMGITEALKW